MGGGSKQLTSLYSNINGSNKSLISAYSNISGTNKQIFSRIYRYGKYTYTYDSHTVKGLYEADRDSDESDTLVNFDDSYTGSMPDLVKVFYDDFYIAKSYSTSVSGSTITVTLNSPERVVPSSSNSSYYFNGKTYYMESGVNGYWILYNGQTSYSASDNYHFGYYITWYAIGWAESVGGNEVRYGKVLVPSYRVIKKLTNTEYINCDTQQYYSNSIAGAETLYYTYSKDYKNIYTDPVGMKNDEVYYKLLN